MPHQPGTKMRKADFEVPYPWSESVKYTRRYRDGWFDAYHGGKQTDKIGTYNSRGRDAYQAGFAAGYLQRPLPAPKPQELAPPQPFECCSLAKIQHGETDDVDSHSRVCPQHGTWVWIDKGELDLGL